MHIPKNYLHDRVVLFLLTINAFIFVASSLATVFRLGGSHEVLYSQFRSNLGLKGYIPGGKETFIQFMLFALFILLFHLFISMKVYHIRHNFARAILALGTLLLVMAAVVSNALLGLS